jgi:anti-sigma regulatory factor (Ser/Thr protein kinase)
MPSLTAADLASVRAFVTESLRSLRCETVIDAMVLAVDEVCANLAEHASTAGMAGPVCISVRCDASDAIIVVEDHGPPFHPADAPAPDLTSDWQDRRVGGLGWFLVRQMVDSLTYEAATFSVAAAPSDQPANIPTNRLTLVKRDARQAPPIGSN